MGKFKTVVLKPKPCCHCGRPSLKGRSYCRPCLNRVRYFGVVDTDDYPSQADARRLRSLVDA